HGALLSGPSSADVCYQGPQRSRSHASHCSGVMSGSACLSKGKGMEEACTLSSAGTWDCSGRGAGTSVASSRSCLFISILPSDDAQRGFVVRQLGAATVTRKQRLRTGTDADF